MNFLDNLGSAAVNVGLKILLAVVVFIVGKIVINAIVKLMGKGKLSEKVEPSVKTFAQSFVRILLYVILVVAIIGILGVPMASIITVLASAGVAIGLALQGALSNFAGGIMLMIFKFFKVGDYVAASGVEGTVEAMTLFYTSFKTVDNKIVTVPNGALMNANITNYSREALRRVDLDFTCSKDETPSRIIGLMMDTMKSNAKVLSDPEPFARVSGGSNEATQYTLRAWCKTEDYWDVYFDMCQGVTEAFGANAVKAPTACFKKVD